jgi:FeS assembly protein IscX
MTTSSPKSETWPEWHWDDISWLDIQDIGAALAEKYPAENLMKLKPERIRELVPQLEGFGENGSQPDDFILGAIIGAWIHAEEGEDDSSPFEHLA